MTVMSCYNLIYLVTDSPLIDRRENRIEIFNEFCILLFCYQVATCLNEAIPENLNDTLGLSLIATTGLNIVVNLCIVLFSTTLQLGHSIRRIYNSKKQKQRDREFEKQRDEFIATYPNHFKKLEGQKKFEQAVNFCLEWKPQRDWLRCNKIDMSTFPEEQQFQRLSKKYNFTRKIK